MSFNRKRTCSEKVQQAVDVPANYIAAHNVVRDDHKIAAYHRLPQALRSSHKIGEVGVEHSFENGLRCDAPNVNLLLEHPHSFFPVQDTTAKEFTEKGSGFGLRNILSQIVQVGLLKIAQFKGVLFFLPETTNDTQKLLRFLVDPEA